MAYLTARGALTGLLDGQPFVQIKQDSDVREFNRKGFEAEYPGDRGALHRRRLRPEPGRVPVSADDILREASWARMRTAITDAAKEYRRLADSLERVPFDNSRGHHAPEAIISEVALTANTNTAATLVHRLASWAETINETERHAAGSSVPLCGYSIDDPYRVCVLQPGHAVPLDDGLLVHVSADGVMFS